MHTINDAQTKKQLNQELIHQLNAIGRQWSISAYKSLLESATQSLYEHYDEGLGIEELLKIRSQSIDLILEHLWQQSPESCHLSCSLIAVGGYGREEMHPASDIDLLILISEDLPIEQQEQLGLFITHLWDIGVEVGHSIRTLNECIDEAKADLTVITNLIESRFLTGSAELFKQLQQAISPNNLWNSIDFFHAKLEEQQQRYNKYLDNVYQVEPNLKEGYGGLRDIQTLKWIIQRHYGEINQQTLKQLDLLTTHEYDSLVEHRNFLWRIRFLLHKMSGKKEDRLLFHYQQELTKAFYQRDNIQNADIERFMQSYYRTITELGRLIELLQNLLKASLLEKKPPLIVNINKDFELVNHFINLRTPEKLPQQPELLLSIFLHLQAQNKCVCISPNTVRLIRENLYLINEDFRQNPRCQALFIDILKQPHNTTKALRAMNRHGILATYIPAFKKIVGLMQFDLYHAYTVDEHTLHVFRNLRRYSTDIGKKELPLCGQIFDLIEKKELLYLAGLFHDIAKGRGGDHSKLGAIDAYDFCRLHGFNREDSTLVSWLVQQHLLISAYIQKKDINDIDVINEFINDINSLNHLNYLVLLTIADIRGTNMKLWTEWKHTLIRQLYFNAKRYWKSNIEDTQNKSLIQQKLDHAKQILAKENIPTHKYLTFWQTMDENYFSQNTATDITWHAKQIATANGQTPLICLRQSNSRNSTMLFIYTKNRIGLFSRISMIFEQNNINIIRAKVSTSKNNMVLNTYVLLNKDNQPIVTLTDQEYLIERLHNTFKTETLPNVYEASYPAKKQLKQFMVPTHIKFNLTHNNQTLLEIKAKDHPGILSKISQVLHQYNLQIHEAWINTLEEQVQDAFYITLPNGQPVTDKNIQSAIRRDLIEMIEPN